MENYFDVTLSADDLRAISAVGLAHLGDAVGNGHAGSRCNVLELGENRLSRLGTQIRDVRGILDRSDDRLEHQIKLTNIGKIVLTTGRTWNVVLFYEAFHLLITPSIYTTF